MRVAGLSPADSRRRDPFGTSYIGLDLMRQIRQRHDLQGICRSGFGMETDLAQTHAAGFSHHLTKPVDLAQLAR